MEDTDMEVMAPPASERRHLRNQIKQDGQHPSPEENSPAAPGTPQRENVQKTLSERWQPLLRNGVILAFLGATIYLSIKCDYLFFEEISSAYFILLLLLILKYSGETDQKIPRFRDDFHQQG